MMTGDVSAWVSQRTLYIRGDNNSNNIEIRQVSASSFRITGREAYWMSWLSRDTTTINRQSSSQTFSGVFDDIDINMNGGSDGVRFYSMVLPDDLRFYGGSGNDVLWMNYVRNRDYNDVMSIDMGSGNDTVIMNSVTSRSSLSIYGGDGNDSVRLESMNVWGTADATSRLYVALGAGNDELRAEGISTAYVTYDGGGPGDTDTYYTASTRQTTRYRYYAFERIVNPYGFS